MRLVIALLALVAALAGRSEAHDLPGQVAVTGYFDARGERPEFVLRVPLILLTNVNLAKRGPGYLDLGDLGDGVARAEHAVRQAFRIEASGDPLTPAQVASRISEVSDRGFDSPEAAVALVEGPPLAETTNIFWNQGYFDLRLTYAEQPLSQTYTLVTDLPPGMAERVLITLGVLAAGEPLRMLTLDGTTPAIALDPRWWQAGSLFLTKGVEHILTGYDHLLFLLCLILPLHRDPRRLLVVVTAFTLGHSLTLIPAALGAVPQAGWFGPAVEAAIAASILVTAVANVLGTVGNFRWTLAFGFGLIHGFGFAATLGDVVPLAGRHLVASLVFFNLGIEVGQIVVLAILVPALIFVLRKPRAQRAGIVLISVLAGHEAWHWMGARLGGLGPTGLLSDGRVFATLTWIGLGLIVALVLWAAIPAIGRGGTRQPAAVPNPARR